MKRYRVELAPDALGQAEVANRWWSENRPEAPALLVDELEAVLERLAVMPRSGKPYERSGMPGMHRLLMPRTRYHVYYTIEEELATVRVHAVWHSSRGGAPDL